MTEQIFSLLSQQPILSISLGFLLAGFLAYVFRGVIKKKYNLYSEQEIRTALEQASDERVFYSKTTEKLTPSIQDRTIKFLKHPNPAV